MENQDIDKAPEQTPKKGRGGARPGAGRKKIYDSTFDFRRLKCKSNLADRARTCITILSSIPDRDLSDIYCTKMNGEQNEWKGARFKTWTDADAFSSKWNIRINDEFDERIFVLALVLQNPRNVTLHWFNHDGTVQLRWKRVDEIGSIMVRYGNLMGRKNRLKASEQEILDKIPRLQGEIMEFLSEQLGI